MIYGGIFRSKDDKESESGSKVPKGFEKFLRKTNKKSSGSSKDVECSKKEETSKDVKKE